MKIILRELTAKDAVISWKWRNDSEVWKFTGRKFNNVITEEIERKWIKGVLLNKNEKRFAICVGEEERYIGNVQLTDINSAEAKFHIFIGEKDFWGQGIGSEATRQILEYGFTILKLERIYLIVKKTNVAAIKAYVKNGFKIIRDNDENLTMQIEKQEFDE